jgi:flagellar biosynthesis protein FlhF
MQTKTYFASSVPAALELARKELGEEAMLVTSKPSSPEARPYGRLEVTFAFDAQSAVASLPIPPSTPPSARSFAASLPRLTMPMKQTKQEGNSPVPVLPQSAGAAFQRLANAADRPLQESRQPVQESRQPVQESRQPVQQSRQPAQQSRQLASEVDEIRRQLSALKMAVTTPRNYEARSSVTQHLIQSGLGLDLAEDIASAPRLRSGSGEGPALVARELAERIPIGAFPEIKPGDGRVLALVGPPGRGKTTTLIKIAMRFGLANRIPVKIYMAGSHGVGCEEQLARYASVLGVPFQACELLENLTLALNGDMWKGLALIDTPGLSPSDSAEIGEFARFFKRRPEIEKHLVLRADARPADISHVIGRFSAMEISRLLFTGLDETVGLGSMADAIMRSGIPAGLAGTGQKIPEDLETVSAAWLARALQRDVNLQVESAALSPGLCHGAAAA